MIVTVAHFNITFIQLSKLLFSGMIYKWECILNQSVTPHDLKHHILSINDCKHTSIYQRDNPIKVALKY